MSEEQRVSLEIAADVQGDVLRVQSNLRTGGEFDAAVYVLVRPGASAGFLIAALNTILAGLEKDEIRAKMQQGQTTWSAPASLVDLCEPAPRPSEPAGDGGE